MMHWLTLDRTVFIMSLLLLFAMASRVPVDTDTWWHIRSGEHTLTQGMIYDDPFSHTFRGERWINHSWGAQVVIYGVWRAAGSTGLSLYTALLAVGGMAALAPVMRGSAFLKAFLMVLGAAAAAWFWSARPQMFSFLLSGVTLWLLYRYRAAPSRRIWWIVPMMALWANLHAGYSIGFIFLGAFIAGEAINRVLGVAPGLTWRQIGQLVAVGLAGAAALVLTPYGLDTVLVPFQTVGIGALRDLIQEWNSPNFQLRETWAVIALIVLMVAAAWASRSPFDAVGFLLFAGTLFMALLYGRNVAVFAIAVLPQLSVLCNDVLTRAGMVPRPRPLTRVTARLHGALVSLVALGVTLFAAAAVWSPAAVARTQAKFLPVAAVDYLRQNPPRETLFNSYNWGGYLIFSLPQTPVFIDGRTDLYGDFLRTYLAVTTGAGDWRGVLERYGVRTVLVERGTGLVAALRDEVAWQLVYEDEMAVIYER
jgi:hypothetical protein